jgi:hypothetical protein
MGRFDHDNVKYLTLFSYNIGGSGSGGIVPNVLNWIVSLNSLEKSKA